MGKKRPDTIKPDMSDYPFPGRSDPEAFNAWNREYMRRFRVLNPEFIKAANKAYNNSPEGKAAKEVYENSPKGKAAREAYNKSPEHKVASKAYEKSPKGKANRKARDNSPEYKAWRKAYFKTPEGKALLKKQQAIRRQAKSMISLTEHERQELVILEQKRLHLIETTGIVHHLDHILPLARGGIHHPINLRIIAAEENLRKGDKVTPEAMALIPQIQAIVNERKGWLNTEQDSTLADLFTTDEDET